MKEEYEEIGKIDKNLLKGFFEVKTERLIITKERIQHINQKHQNDYDNYGKYIPEIIKSPDYVLVDVKNDDTILYLKTIKKINLQLVVKLQTKNEIDKVNTVLTFWHMRIKSYENIIKKNKKIFSRT